MTTAVVDNLTISLEDLKHYLRVDHDADDTLILELAESAKASADAYLNNPFAGLADVPVPVKTWVLKRTAALYENRLEGARQDDVTGLGNVDYGRLLSDTGGSADFTLLRPYRLNPGL